jgi:hypothetical protein
MRRYAPIYIGIKLRPAVVSEAARHGVKAARHGVNRGVKTTGSSLAT